MPWMMGIVTQAQKDAIHLIEISTDSRKYINASVHCSPIVNFFLPSSNFSFFNLRPKNQCLSILSEFGKDIKGLAFHFINPIIFDFETNMNSETIWFWQLPGKVTKWIVQCVGRCHLISVMNLWVVLQCWETQLKRKRWHSKTLKRVYRHLFT